MQPNFVLFVTDQHRADHLGCYGHPVLKTPNIDSLADRGTRFEHFYVASPVCMPNRASLMTGRMPSAHGVRCNGIPLSRNNVTFVELLHDAGYDTGLIGKCHLQNFSSAPPLHEARAADSSPTPSRRALPQAVRDHLDGLEYRYESPEFWAGDEPRLELPFYGFNHAEIVTGHGDGAGGDYARWLASKMPDARRLIGPENQLRHDYQCPQAVRTALPEELYSTSYIAERAEAYLKSPERKKRPFFLMVSFPDPHHPFNPPGRYWGLYDPADMPVPAAFEREDWTPPPHVQALFDVRSRNEAALNGMNSVAVSLQESLEARALTCGMISMIDDAVGRVQEAFTRAGLSKNIVSIFTSDHGDHLGDHRLLLKGAEQYRDILRVPFIWSEAAGQSRISPAIGSTLDIPASILDRAGIRPYAGIQGQSLLPVVEGQTESGREAAFIQFDHQRSHPGLGGSPRVHTLADRNWRLSVYQDAAWGELYDLRNDPGEFVNLWDDPAYAVPKASLLERLLRAEIAYTDRVPLPTGLA